jgi:hypothetical protein
MNSLYCFAVQSAGWRLVEYVSRSLGARIPARNFIQEL